MRVNWLVYLFLPKLKVVSFSEGVREVGRVYRYIPGSLMVVKFPGKVMTVEGEIPLIPDREGYVLLGEVRDGVITPYFTNEQFDALRKGVDVTTLVRMVSEEEREKVEELNEYFINTVKDVMEKLKLAASKNIELMGSEIIRAEEIVSTAIKGKSDEQDVVKKLMKAVEEVHRRGAGGEKEEEGGEEGKTYKGEAT